MDINKLEYFFAAAELQNFTQAAEKCNIAQTTMSKYIHLLEPDGILKQIMYCEKKGWVL